MDVGVDCGLEIGDGKTAGNDLWADFEHNPPFRNHPGIKGLRLDLGELKQKEEEESDPS